MIKSFVQRLTDNKKVYEFKIRLALEATPKVMDRIEKVLDAYQLESISAPKRLPIQEDIINFPKLGPVEINLIEVSLAYPTIPEQIRNLLYERAGIPMTHMAVYTAGQCEFKELNPDYERKDALLNTPLEESEEEKVYGNEYIESFLDSLETTEMPIAGDRTEKMATTNDLPQGTDSPMTKKTKLPDPYKDY